MIIEKKNLSITNTERKRKRGEKERATKRDKESFF